MTRPDALELTRQLIARPSVSPDDAGCQELLIGHLLDLGFEVERLPFGEVTNFWARRGRAAPLLCFAGHTDVVPPGSAAEWHSDPFQPVVRDGLLYGRGAADMKSALGAMLEATARFVETHPRHRGSLAWLITSDEEGAARDGTRRVMELLSGRGERIDWCLVGEPSSDRRLGDTLKIGRRGSLSGRLTVHGIQGHVAYPQLADNPIHRFAPALAELTRREWDRGNAHFQPTSFQVVNISSGVGASNVIPGELKARFNLRYSPEQTLAGLKDTVCGILERHELRFELEWHLSGEPFYTPPGELSAAVAAAVSEATGSPPQLSTAGGTSDGRFIAPAGAAVIELGVVNATIHKVNECVPVRDIARLEVIYFRILERLLG